LTKIELTDSTGAMMTVALKDAIRQKKWIAVTGWTPHWKWGTWKLKYLKDPKMVFGSPDEGSIKTLVRKGLDKDMPRVYAFLDNFMWTADQMAAVMVWIKDGMEPYDAAKKFIAENKALVDGWLK
ncbi:MAG: glycine/betaine ABC transporter substrate-binding protein, partial [Okeania sp. SIO3B3]|nr:glycine/betaine ABC transporter substrate-binding protein [Okeania sp. SIO3B3]